MQAAPAIGQLSKKIYVYIYHKLSPVNNVYLGILIYTQKQSILQIKSLIQKGPW